AAVFPSVWRRRRGSVPATPGWERNLLSRLGVGTARHQLGALAQRTTGGDPGSTAPWHAASFQSPRRQRTHTGTSQFRVCPFSPSMSEFGFETLAERAL